MTSATLPAVHPPSTPGMSGTCSNGKNLRLTKMSSEERLIALQLAILNYYTSHRWLLMSEAMIETLQLANVVLHNNRGYTRMYRRLCMVVEQEQLHEDDEAIREAVQS